MHYLLVVVLLSISFLHAFTASANDWPALPDENATVEIPAQEWPHTPGARTVSIRVHYPNGKLAHVGAATGLMLTLHNWGGVDCVGTADPQTLADELDVTAVCVNYLQSGNAGIEHPYDFGYLQALDALRALWYVEQGLNKRAIDYAEGCVYTTGGSGGGNVSLMANKLAPRTFAAVIDMCGMKKLSDDIAYDLPGGVDLNARYSRDPASPHFLSREEQLLRYVGNPDHLAVMKSLGTQCKILVVHGVDDPTYGDALEMVDWMQRAAIDVEAHWIGPGEVDGTNFTTTGHALGNRTKIVLQVAGKYLQAGSAERLVRMGPSDFERRETIRYPTPNGAFEISYADGYPVARFVAAEPLPDYPDHTDLAYVLPAEGPRRAVATPADWQLRREHVLRHFQRVAGPLPTALERVPLDVQVLEEVGLGALVRRKVSYQSDPVDRVTAYVFVPPVAQGQRVPGVLCLQQTTVAGKDEAAGVRGDPTMKYALELAERGYVTIAPDYPSFGEHAYDFDPNKGYVSGTMKAIWDNRRALDLLETLPEVDHQRLACIGHSLGGHNGIFTALFEPRIKALVTSCGFTSFERDDLPSWTGPRYMPRIASEFGSDRARVPFEFHELVASLAPRPVFISAATGDADFDVTGVRDVVASARQIYQLLGHAEHLVAHYPEAPHSFPDEARAAAYRFLDEHLRGR